MVITNETRKINDPAKFRQNVCKKFVLLIENEKNSINLEKGVYNYALKEATNRKVVKKWENCYFIQIYLDRLRSIFLNLKNPLLIAEIKNNNINVKHIAFMSHQEMKPEKLEQLIQDKIKRDKSKYETQLEAMTDTFKCRSCHSVKCSYYCMQTRSADEPTTIFVTCIDCGKRWKC